MISLHIFKVSRCEIFDLLDPVLGDKFLRVCAQLRSIRLKVDTTRKFTNFRNLHSFKFLKNLKC
jgi:hypothetical protein